MNSFLERFEQAILDHKLIEEKQAILVAVSGGVDSMVLVHAFNQLSEKYGWRLQIAHLNHQLRGRSSDADERLVRQTATRLGIKVVVKKADVRLFASKENVSIEMAARQIRHQFLAEVARRHNIRSIAVAHHADDQVELFFLRLFRGAGSEGLAGMDWAAPSPVGPSRRLIRPLLGFSKDELKEWAASEKLRFREDRTNRSLDILRNRVRHELLPLLKAKYQPAIFRTTLRLMEIARAESEFLAQSLGESAMGKEFSLLPTALQRRLLQSGLIRLGIDPNFVLIEELRRSEASPVMVGPEIIVERDNSGDVRLRAVPRSSFNRQRLALSLSACPSEFSFSGVQIQWSISPWKKKTIRTLAPKQSSLPSGVEIFDAGKIGDSIVLRHWQRGDRFQPIGMSVPVKLQDLFVNQKIPRDQRHKLLVLATDTGELVWVEGVRISERFKLDKDTQSQLKWSWRRA